MPTPDGDRRGVGDAPREALLRLAVEHHHELMTGNCLEILRQFADLRSTAPEEPIPTAAAWRVATAHHRRGELPQAIAYCNEADAPSGTTADRALLSATHASVLWAQGVKAARGVADQALQLAQESHDPLALGHAWAAQALAHALEGDREQNRFAYEKALEYARACGDHSTVIRVQSNLGSLHSEAGRYEDAFRHLDEACDLAAIHSAGTLGAIAHTNRSEALLAQGRLDEALVEVGTARDLYRNAESPLFAFALLAEAEVHRIRGNAVRASIGYREAISRAGATGNAQVLVAALAGLARTTVLDDPAMAISYAKQALAQPAALGEAVSMLAAGWVSLATGDREDAGRWADEAIEDAGRRQQLPLIADALELRALAREDTAAALEDLQEAFEIWQESGNVIDMEVNRVVTARLSKDHRAEDTARHALAAFGVHVDVLRIAGPMQVIGSPSRPEVEVRTLGTFSVVVRGQPVATSSWPSRKSRELITVLAARRGRPISRDALADLLWPGVLDTANRLSVALSTARAALDPQKLHPPDRYLVADRQHVHLDVSTVMVDLVEFERVATAALEAARRGKRDALGLLQAADALYPAPFLADEPAPEWAEEVRNDLQDLALQVKRAMIALLQNAGEKQRAATALLALVAEDPYDESAHLDLIMTLHRAGRHGEARRAHRRYVSCMTELGIEAQPLSTLLRQEAPHVPAVPSALVARRRRAVHHLPPASPLVGRRQELANLTHLLDRHRCVTVTGTGGIGKTRLALAAAQSIADETTDVWFVDLTAARDHPERQLLTTIGITEEVGSRPTSSATAHLRGRHALVVLDNCEHLLDPVRALVDELLENCPDLRVLLTSIERVGAAGEQTLVLPPLLGADEATGGLAGTDAVELFLTCVRSVQPSFTADLQQVARICEKCDGLPLAIELAAARCASLGIDGLLSGLDDRLRLLTSPPDHSDRHRSVRSVLDWSHDLLSPGEQRVFRRLGIFADDFDLAAATAVAGAGLSAATMADLIGRLADKHLIERRGEGDGSRWRMLGIVRGYARERLDTSVEARNVTEAYHAWATNLAAHLVERCRTGEPWRDDFDAAAADIHAALDVSRTHPGRRLELALALATLEERRGGLSAARLAAETAIAVARDTGESHQLARAALGASLTGMLFGVTQEHRVALLSEALSALPPDDHPLRARVMARLATELYWSAQRDRSIQLVDEAVALADRLDDDGALAHALYAQHYVTRGAGTNDQRLTLASRAIRHARLAQETQVKLASRAALAVDLLEAGDLAGMERETADLLAAARQFDHPEFQWYATTYRLVLALIRGEYDEVARLQVEAEERARDETEFGIGLLFALAVTDRRPRTDEALAKEQRDLALMARRFPRIIVWRCELLLVDLARGATPDATGRAKALADEVLEMSRDDAHWLLAATLAAEGLAALPEAAEEFAGPLEEALRPYADVLAVGGRVAACRGSVAHALGLLALARGHRAQAIADLTHAVEVHQRIGAVPLQERSIAALERARATE